MNYFTKLLFLLTLISITINASCEYKYEYNEATSTRVIKNIFDYAGKVNKIEVVPGYYGSWSTANRFWRERKSAGGWNTFDLPNNSYQVGGITIPWKRNAGSIRKNKLWSSYYRKQIDVQVFFGARNGGRGSDTWLSTKIRIYYPNTTKVVLTCPDGYKEIASPTGGAACKKIMTYDYIKYTCPIEKNIQGFSWKLATQETSDGSKIDSSLTTVTDLTKTLYSHDVKPQCKRKYQECIIGCISPLELDKVSGKCVADYTTICEHKGLIYNDNTKKCEKTNQCKYDEAYKDNNSSYCIMMPNCSVSDGVCANPVKKTCEVVSFLYNVDNNQCEDKTNCLSSEFVLNDGLCGGAPFCKDGDIQTIKDCVNAVKANKSCLPDNRVGNLCFVSNGENINIDYKHPLIKTIVTGGFKEAAIGEKLGILCTDSDNQCQYRLTKIYTEDYGKSLCFEDAQGVSSCVKIDGDCSLSGRIEYENGIKQLEIVDGNKINAYNLQDNNKSIGSIESTCVLSGKVGSFEGSYKTSDIIAVKANGSDIKFWDQYERGFIGVISLLPTIPKEDLDNGYTYADKDTFKLLNKGFTGFYSEDESVVYGVYNGFISKENCENLIDGTSFYIAAPTSEAEASILAGLNFKSSHNYNFNDGDLLSGSCVIKSEISKSFNNQKFSIKSTTVSDSGTAYMCSPFSCKDHSCQFNQCPTNYNFDVYEQSYFDLIVNKDFPSAVPEEICQDNLCDSNKPYFRFCGSNYGCKNQQDIYQQPNGSCIQVTCRTGETLDATIGRCVSKGCKDSFEKDGKCYKTIK